MIQFISKLFFCLIFITASYTTSATEMNYGDAHLMAVASDCAYMIGKNKSVEDSDRKNIEKCFSDYGFPEVKYIDSHIVVSRLGIDAFYWAKIGNDNKLI